MAIRFGNQHTFGDISQRTGKELLELWLKIGSIKKARIRYNSEHPNDTLSYDNIFSRRIHCWAIKHVPEMIELIQSYDSDVTTKMIHEKILYYAVRIFKKYKSFMYWAEENPWVKEYETDYNKWYGQSG